jgi:5-methylcytosine-specific restriction endonuclease McrA
MLACVDPQPDVPSSLRAAPKPAALAPLSARTYLLKVTLSQQAHDDLQRCRELLRHAVPSGDPAAIVERALGLLAESAARTKVAATARPRDASPEVTPRAIRREATGTTAPSRRLPAAVKRAVWSRDGARCAFVGTDGRCRETGFLEFHHVVPFAAGGATDVDNLQLRCRSHNAHEARLYFGTELEATSKAPG